MNTNQVRVVLLALIALGIAAAIVGLVQAGTDEDRLTNLLPMSPGVIDEVVIKSQDDELHIEKVSEDLNVPWRLDQGQYKIDMLRFAEFWSIVSRFEGAQLVSNNPIHHARMGVDDVNGIELMFMRLGGLQERFIVGTSQGLADEAPALCYLRRQAENETYAVACAYADIIVPDRDGWRDPAIVQQVYDGKSIIELGLVSSFTIRYPSQDVNKAIEISIQGNQPLVIVPNGPNLAANAQTVNLILTTLIQLRATGFATVEEANSLNWDIPDVSVLLEPVDNVPQAPERLYLMRRDQESYWVRNLASSTVYVVPGSRVEPMLVQLEDLLEGTP